MHDRANGSNHFGLLWPKSVPLRGSELLGDAAWPTLAIRAQRTGVATLARIARHGFRASTSRIVRLACEPDFGHQPQPPVIKRFVVCSDELERSDQ
jgi:hypothetical protein